MCSGGVAGGVSSGGVAGDVSSGRVAGDMNSDGVAGDVSSGVVAGDVCSGGVAGDVSSGRAAGDVSSGGAAGEVSSGGVAGDVNSDGVAGDVSSGGVAGGLLVLLNCKNADVATLNPLKTISYQILLKHQVFIVCIMILFQIVLLCLFLDLKKIAQVTEMRGITVLVIFFHEISRHIHDVN